VVRHFFKREVLVRTQVATFLEYPSLSVPHWFPDRWLPRVVKASDLTLGVSAAEVGKAGILLDAAASGPRRLEAAGHHVRPLLPLASRAASPAMTSDWPRGALGGDAGPGRAAWLLAVPPPPTADRRHPAHYDPPVTLRANIAAAEGRRT